MYSITWFIIIHKFKILKFHTCFFSSTYEQTRYFEQFPGLSSCIWLCHSRRWDKRPSIRLDTHLVNQEYPPCWSSESFRRKNTVYKRNRPACLQNCRLDSLTTISIQKGQNIKRGHLDWRKTCSFKIILQNKQHSFENTIQLRQFRLPSR